MVIGSMGVGECDRREIGRGPRDRVSQHNVQPSM